MFRLLRHAILPAFAFFFVLELMLVGAIEFWPDFRENIAGIRIFTQFKVLRGLVGLLKEGELPGYIVFQHFFKGSLLGVTVSVMFAVNAVAGEAHRGTLEILLARPLSRTRIIMERYLLGALQIVIPLALTTWTIPYLLMERWGEEIALYPLMLGSVHMSCMYLAIHGTTFFFSTIGRHPIRIAIGMFFFCVLQFAVYLMMDATQYSLVQLVDPLLFIDLFTTEQLNWNICGGLLGYTALTVAMSIFAFRRRLP